MTVNMPWYAQEYRNDSTIGTDIRIFNLNSIRTPAVSFVSSTRPAGYAQWSVAYSKYRVFAVDCEISVVNLQKDAPLKVGWVATNNSAPQAQDDTIFEQPHVSTRILSAVGGMDRAVFRRKYYLPNLTGSPAVRYKSDDRYAGQILTSDPMELMYGCLVARNLTVPAGGQAPISYSYTVKLIYHVELFDRFVQSAAVDQALLEAVTRIRLPEAESSCGCTGPTGPTGPSGGGLLL